MPASGSTFPLGMTQVNCSVTDSGGLSTSAFFTVTVQDNTAPVIANHDDVTADATGPNGANVTYTSPATTDAVDGPGTANCTPASGSQFPLGTTEVTCTATDNAGNTATSKFNVKVAYAWSNFLQPINLPDPTTGTFTAAYPQSVFKQGSRVPVKFKLTGASAGITDGTFYIKYVRTGSGDGAGEAEAVSTSASTTGNLFRYDATAGQYIFNWSTKSVTAGNWDIKVYSDSAYKNLLGSVSVELKK